MGFFFCIQLNCLNLNVAEWKSAENRDNVESVDHTHHTDQIYGKCHVHINGT